MIEKGAVTENSFVKDRIDNAIKQAMTARGLALGGTQPDLVVRYAAGARTVRELETAGVPPMVGPMWGPYPQDFWVTEHPEGTLIIDLNDGKTAKLLWRAHILSEGPGPERPIVHPEGGQQGLREVSAGGPVTESSVFTLGLGARRPHF